MFLIRNAVKNIFRNKGRYLLVAMIMILMIVSAVISSMINVTTTSVIHNYSLRFGARVTFTPDLKKVIQLPTNEAGIIEVPEITTKQLMDFSNSDCLKSTLFTGTIQGYSDSLKGLDQGGQEANGLGGFLPSNENVVDVERKIPNLVVIGHSELSLMEEFQIGFREISKGNMYQKETECVISEELSKLNQLDVGDTITVTNVDSLEYTLTLIISGIYTDGTTAQSNGSSWAVNNRRNEILTSYDTMSKQGTEGVHTQAVFYLKSPGDAMQFEEEVREMGLPEIYNVNTDASSYNQIVKPVEGLNKVSILLSSIIFIFGGTVIVLLSVLLVRERKYEIGVLRAMGLEKKRVAYGFIMESLLVLILCFCIGVSIGTVAAQPVANIILEDQIQIAKESQFVAVGNYGEGVMTDESNQTIEYSELNNIEITNSVQSMALTISLAVVLGFISSAVGLIYIMRYEPLKLLTQGGE